MKKVLVGIAIVIVLLPAHLNLNSQIQIYISEGNIYKSVFKEPFESVYIQLWNGDFFVITNRIEHRILVPVEYLRSKLAKKGSTIKDIILIIHNHYAKPYFSYSDRLMYKKLKREGFNGLFMVYIQATGNVIKYNQ